MNPKILLQGQVDLGINYGSWSFRVLIPFKFIQLGDFCAFSMLMTFGKQAFDKQQGIYYSLD